MKSSARNEWLRSGEGLRVYLRKSVRVIGGAPYRCIDLANATNPSRTPKMDGKSTGKFGALCLELEAAGVEFGYDAIYMENVISPFLSESILRKGYDLVPPVSSDLLSVPCYWKKL